MTIVWLVWLRIVSTSSFKIKLTKYTFALPLYIYPNFNARHEWKCSRVMTLFLSLCWYSLNTGNLEWYRRLLLFLTPVYEVLVWEWFFEIYHFHAYFQFHTFKKIHFNHNFSIIIIILCLCSARSCYKQNISFQFFLAKQLC